MSGLMSCCSAAASVAGCSLGRYSSKPRELTEVDLERAYRSSVDPRLNYEQSLEIAMAIVRKQGQRQADARV